MSLSKVSPQKVSINAKNFTINFSNTKRDEKIEISRYDTNYFLDTNGTLYEKQLRTVDSVKVIVVGGDHRFLFQKDTSEEPEIYITPPQIKAIKEMMKYLSYSGGEYPTISSDSEYLQNLINSYYYNFRG